ncbi:hypothetical protein QQG74_00250 [Micromonospora sp. FIMYZ51]|uniref:hypothetical protein n=1 Tax=Micromonospora sp. FIMYZ51 TaxID=3051832 RepID=UPI00311FAF7F
MRETDLEQMFAEFEASAAPTFRPPGLPAVRRRARDRRRRRRGLLTGIVALLLTGPAGAYAVAGRGGESDPPTPDPSPSTDERLIERRVHPTGVAGRLTGLRFVSSQHGWALFDTCQPVDQPSRTDCRRDLARTVDGGQTWQRTPLPDAANRPRQEGAFYLLAVDERTLTVGIGGGYLVSTDGGASFSEHPREAPPEATRRGVATRSGYLLQCPGSGPLIRLDCAEFELARVGAPGPPTQPPVVLPNDAEPGLVEGGDGRLWVTGPEGGRLRTVVSADGAASWRQLPAVSGAVRLLVSPDGRDAWLVGMSATAYDGATPKRVWRLIDDRWREQTELPPDTNSVAAVNDGLLVVTNPWGNVGYWTGERYIDVPEARGPRFGNGEDDPTVEVLPDDTIVITTRTATTLGSPTQPRTWIRLTH